MTSEELAVIYIDDSGGTPVNITASVTGYEGPSTGRTSQNYYTMDSVEPKVSTGNKTGTVSITVLEEAGASTPSARLFQWHEAGDVRTITINVPNESSGSTRYSAEYRPTGEVRYSRGQAGSLNPRTATHTFQREGALTRTVIP